jgi:PadR family transcriptional regulator PadR
MQGLLSMCMGKENAMSAAEELYEKWKSQFRKGFLELCVLELLSKSGRSYGLAIMEQLNNAGVDVTEGTLYPLLMRMTKDESIEAQWETPDVGHPRKYYVISRTGSALLGKMREEYERSAAARRTIMTGGHAE